MENRGYLSTADFDRKWGYYVVPKYIEGAILWQVNAHSNESFANMVKASNLNDHAIKNCRIDTGESSSKSKKGNFSKKNEGET